jgi:hypothetical protein
VVENIETPLKYEIIINYLEGFNMAHNLTSVELLYTIYLYLSIQQFLIQFFYVICLAVSRSTSNKMNFSKQTFFFIRTVL